MYLLHNLDIRYKNSKKLHCEYIPSYRPSGGYLRYAILINPIDRIHLKKCLEDCLKVRKQHHSLCKMPDTLESVNKIPILVFY